MSVASNGVIFGGLQWNSQKVVFHAVKGRNVKLSEQGTVATKQRDDYTTVFTGKPLAIGQMFCVSQLKKDTFAVGGVKIGFTKGDPQNPRSDTLLQQPSLTWQEGDPHLLHIDGINMRFNGQKICALGIHTADLGKKLLGILLTREGYKVLFHWFLDGIWKGCAQLNDAQRQIDWPLWGVIQVVGQCKQVAAFVWNVHSYHQLNEPVLVQLGLIRAPQPPPPVYLGPAQQPPVMSMPQPDPLCQLSQEQELVNLQQQLRRKNEQIQQKDDEIQRLQLLVSKKARELDHQHQQIVSTDIKDCTEQLIQAIDAENKQQIETCSSLLQQKLSTLSAQNHNPHNIELWQVSPEEVSVWEDKVIERGAWGYIAKGTFRGTTVAVKRVYPEILQRVTTERLHHEIRTMSQIRHPNLVLFIAAVLDEQTGPVIVTELLDTSLRAAYQGNLVGPNKRKIFENISSALLYLHRQREPIIHRDVSSANVLLFAMPNNSWLAKLGSAKLACFATTPGEGAILYTAPETFPQAPNSPQPQQTTKIDVYSFGVLVCEVVTGTLPEAQVFGGLLARVGGVWPQIHPLITSCVSCHPQDRPTMDTVLQQIKQLDLEP